MKVRWTKEALLNVQEIEGYIAKDNPVAAIKFTEKIISIVENLTLFPEKGRIVPELSFEQIREVIFKNYRIVYLLKKDSIDILTIFEAHKLLSKEYIVKTN